MRRSLHVIGTARAARRFPCFLDTLAQQPGRGSCTSSSAAALCTAECMGSTSSETRVRFPSLAARTARVSASFSAASKSPCCPTPHQPSRQRTCWAALCGWCAGVLLCVLTGAAAVVVCRPLDTPAYLIPYYLRDAQARFQHYATVRKRKGGPLYMTVEDFVLALLASPEKALPDPAIVDDLRQLFEAMDANGDGFISFPEFRFLMSLLTSSPRDMETLFRVADVSGTGRLGLEEFANVLRGVTKDEAVVRSLLKPSTRRNGVVRSLFGDADHPRLCSFGELAKVVHELRTEVWKAEFRQYDVEKNNSITAEEFAELIAQQVLGSHLPYYLVSNIRKLRGSGDVVTLDMWLGLNEVMLHASDLATNVEMFSSSGLSITKPDFRRLMRIADLPDLPKTTVDLIFAVFDKNNDGTMEIEEFLFIMRKKVQYHYSVPPRSRKTLPRRFVECTSAAVAELSRSS